MKGDKVAVLATLLSLSGCWLFMPPPNFVTVAGRGVNIELAKYRCQFFASRTPSAMYAHPAPQSTATFPSHDEIGGAPSGEVWN